MFFKFIRIPAAKVLGNIAYCEDAGHLNTQGAYVLVPWLIDKLADEIRSSEVKRHY